MRNLLSIGLLCCLVVPFFGTWSFLSYRKQCVRTEVKSALLSDLSKDKLVAVRIAKGDEDALIWKDDIEFKYQNQMYDVAEVEVLADAIIYWCILDHAETTINNEIANLVQKATGQDPQQNRSKQHLVDFLKTLYHPGSLEVTSLSQTFSIQSMPLYTGRLLSWYTAPPSPPPKLV